MSVLEKIAFYQQRRDEAPNQELARELASEQDTEGIGVIAQNLWHKNRNVQSDCLKVLYEIGYLDPELIADYYPDYLKLLENKNNRLVWGAMIALSTIAHLRAVEIWSKIDILLDAFQQGSVITEVSGMKTFGILAQTNPAYLEKLLPVFIKTLKNCSPRLLPTHTESIIQAIKGNKQAEILGILEARRDELNRSQYARLRKLLKNQLGVLTY